MDPGDLFISKVVSGKSFADIGGLWGTGQNQHGERVTLAYKHGAFSLTMVDAYPMDDLWKIFEERCRSYGLELAFQSVSKRTGTVHCIIRDVQDFADPDNESKFDVVNCSGVIYHVPNPMRLLAALHNITREYLILTSIVTPRIISSSSGTLQIPDAAPLFLPALSGKEQEIVKSHWVNLIGENGATGLTKPTDLGEWNVNNFGTWWWLYTVKTLQSMCSAAGFDLVDDSLYWNDHSYTLLLRSRIPSVESQRWVVKPFPKPLPAIK